MGKIELSGVLTAEIRKTKKKLTAYGYVYDGICNPNLVDIINDLDDKINTQTKSIVDLIHNFGVLLDLLKSELNEIRTNIEEQRMKKIAEETEEDKTVRCEKCGAIGIFSVVNGLCPKCWEEASEDAKKRHEMGIDDKTIIIELFQGVVSEVKGLPEGWSYKILDVSSLDGEEVEG